MIPLDFIDGVAETFVRYPHVTLRWNDKGEIEGHIWGSKLLFIINKHKENSLSCYMSRSKRKWYKEYKHAGEFTRFIDKWHPILFPKQ